MADEFNLLVESGDGILQLEAAGDFLLEGPRSLPPPVFGDCRTVASGSMSLHHDSLGTLEFTPEAGFVLVEFEIGWPAERPVVRNRALGDGVFDESKYVGSRAVTATLRLDNSSRSIQAMYDQLAPFLSPRVRPTLRWALPGSPDELRALTVRGVNLPLAITGPRHPTVVAQWVSTDAFIKAAIEQCVTVLPGGAGVIGRTYDLTFNRTYPFALPDGSREVVNSGTAPAPWAATIFGAIQDPIFDINGTAIEFTGLTLTAGQTVVIDVENRSILFGGDPAESRYNLANYADWRWDDLLLQPGLNLIRLEGTSPVNAAATLCWTDRWY